MGNAWVECQQPRIVMTNTTQPAVVQAALRKIVAGQPFTGAVAWAWQDASDDDRSEFQRYIRHHPYARSLSFERAFRAIVEDEYVRTCA